MDRPFLDRLDVQNYGCLKDTTVTLSPLHALIGPNDSGKSTILQALRTASLLAAGWNSLSKQDDVGVKRFLSTQPRAATITCTSASESWKVQSAGLDRLHGNPIFGEQVATNRPTVLTGVGSSSQELRRAPGLKSSIESSNLLRLDPDEMRQPSPLIVEGQPFRFTNDRGAGLPAVLDGVLIRDMDSFNAINEQMRALFPAVKSIRLRNVGAQKALGILLKDGTLIDAEQMSEGMLYFLAFAALPYLEPVSLLLIEEPENGLHPSRIADVMWVLRELSKTIQVVLATHSPLVVNELEGHEISVITRTPEAGTKAVLLKDTFHYEQRARIYNNGELWLAHADGKQESELLNGPAEAT
jgi:predicted ATPase